MIHAQIKNNVIENTIVTDENTPLHLFAQGFDHLVRIDELEKMPGIGWHYDGANFCEPAPEVEVS